MRIKKFIIFLFPILLVGCINITSKNKNFGNILSTALNSFMTLDKVTSLKSIKNISIDLKSIQHINDDDKAKIIKELKKGSTREIKFDSLDKLEADGLYDKNNKYLNGILFTISEIDKINDNKYTIKTSIYNSGDTSTEALCTVEYLNGIWKATKTEILIPQDTKG